MSPDSNRANGCRIRSCDVPIRVRYSEVDRQNAVHNSRYAVYFELARTELFRLNGCNYRELEDQGIPLVVAKLECRFRSPARYDDELIVTSTLGDIDRVRIEHTYRIVRPADDQLITTGRTVVAHVDQKGRLQPLPTFLRPE